MKKINKEGGGIPACIGIIMDGNRRWAREQDFSVSTGHYGGYKKLKEVVLWAKDAGVKNIIVYAFSTENWNRNKVEVDMLMKLFGKALSSSDDFKKEDIKVTFIGEKEGFPKGIIDGMKTMESDTKNCKMMNLAIAISYGGRAEIVCAVNKLLQKNIKSISEKEFSDNLWTKNIPDPDMIIRPGGERRLSNFLTWQSVYSELFFTDTYWPAFTKKEFKSILAEYKKRERRNGK